MNIRGFHLLMCKSSQKHSAESSLLKAPRMWTSVTQVSDVAHGPLILYLYCLWQDLFVFDMVTFTWTCRKYEHKPSFKSKEVLNHILHDCAFPKIVITNSYKKQTAKISLYLFPSLL
jgi:hypothetical protein